MEDIKKMESIKIELINAKRINGDVPFIPVWIPKDGVDMLIRWLDNKILFEQSYGKEGRP